MKRIYRITIVIEREYDRKATAEVKRIRDLVSRSLPRGVILGGWTVAKTSIANRAIPERKPRIANEAREMQMAEDDRRLAELQAIADRIAAPFPTLTRPRLEWKGNRYCPSFSGHDAHAHIGRGRWGRGQYRLKNGRSRPIPKGLICIDRRVGNDSPERIESLLAHEIAHLKSQRGNRAGRQHEAERTLYETYKYGAVIEPIFPEWLFAYVPPEMRCQYPGCENRGTTGWNVKDRREPIVIDGTTWYRTLVDLRTCDEYLHNRWGEAWSLTRHSKPSEIKARLLRRRSR